MDLKRDRAAVAEYPHGICGDRGKCGKAKGELDPDGRPHEVHVQYDPAGFLLVSWWSKEHYENNPVEFTD